MNICPSLSSFFTSVKLVSYSSFFFETKNIKITFNAEPNTWPFERLKH